MGNESRVSSIGIVLFLLSVLLGTKAFAELQQGSDLPALDHSELGYAATPCPDAEQVSFADIEPFVDGVMATQFRSHDLAGATISIVHCDKTILKKGYGFSNIEARKPIEPDVTLFRAASISKLFTWTAVMQLVEQGKLDLDGDVNTYLTQFQIPDTFKSPITIRHLMTHTAGFEDRPMVGLFLEHEEELVPLDEYLKIKLPTRVRPPGSYTAYSNYGTALAGLIVQNVSDVSFDAYIEENIFAPLEMKHASFREPLPDRLAETMATGYVERPTVLEPQGFEYAHSVGPAAGLSVSAGDMVNFMRAHLNDGRFSSEPCSDNPCGRSILQPETARRMHQQLFAHDPRLPGVAYGFWEIGGSILPAIGHSGDTVYFHSQLALVPEAKFGLFVSFNAPDGAAAASNLMQTVLERYFSLPDKKENDPGVLDGFEDRAKKIVGQYRPNRRSFTKTAKVAVFPVVLSVQSIGDGIIDVQGAGGVRLREVEPFYFKELDGSQEIVFEVNSDGSVTRFFLASIPSLALDKLGPLEDPKLHILVFSLVVIAALSSLWNGIRHPSRVFGHGKNATRAILALLTVNLLALVFLVWFALIMITSFDTMVFGYPSALIKALSLPVIGGLLWFLTPYFTIGIWRGGDWSAWQRTKYTANTLLLALFFYVLHYWNLLGWRL